MVVRSKSPKTGFVVWLTGLPASGKTTIAERLLRALRRRRLKVELLDGDEIRKTISLGMGFSKEDRDAHNRRIVHVCRLLTRNGINAIVSLISPYRSTREFARENLTKFVEVYVKCPVDECIRRDPKGLYRKALAGEITNMTGIQDPYEEPSNPEAVVETRHDSPARNTANLLRRLEDLGHLKTSRGRAR